MLSLELIFFLSRRTLLDISVIILLKARQEIIVFDLAGHGSCKLKSEHAVDLPHERTIRMTLNYGFSVLYTSCRLWLVKGPHIAIYSSQ